MGKGVPDFLVSTFESSIGAECGPGGGVSACPAVMGAEIAWRSARNGKGGPGKWVRGFSCRGRGCAGGRWE